jgi:hypothetical protein
MAEQVNNQQPTGQQEKQPQRLLPRLSLGLARRPVMTKAAVKEVERYEKYIDKEVQKTSLWASVLGPAKKVRLKCW